MFWAVGATPESMQLCLQLCLPLGVDRLLLCCEESCFVTYFFFFLSINLKLDFKQESMAVQVRHALSKQVRKKNGNKIHSLPNNQQSMHDWIFTYFNENVQMHAIYWLVLVLVNRPVRNVWQTHYFLDVRHSVVFYKLITIYMCNEQTNAQ